MKVVLHILPLLKQEGGQSHPLFRNPLMVFCASLMYAAASRYIFSASIFIRRSSSPPAGTGMARVWSAAKGQLLAKLESHRTCAGGSQRNQPHSRHSYSLRPT